MPIQHPLYQVASALLAVSYVTPNLLALRFILFLASVFFVLWGWLVLDTAVDTVTWNVIFAVVNLAQAGYLIYQQRPVQFTHPEHEQVYEQLFQQTMSRLSFKTLVEGKAFLRELQPGATYVDEGSKSYYLSVLISGKLLVSKRSKDGSELLLGRGLPFQFMDSPQWITRKTRSDAFEVSIRAEEHSVYLCWPRENLEDLFAKPEFKHLETALEIVCGNDVAHKLFDIDRNVVAQSEEQDPTPISRSFTRRNSLPRINIDSDGRASSHEVMLELTPKAHMDSSAAVMDMSPVTPQVALPDIQSALVSRQMNASLSLGVNVSTKHLAVGSGHILSSPASTPIGDLRSSTSKSNISSSSSTGGATISTSSKDPEIVALHQRINHLVGEFNELRSRVDVLQSIEMRTEAAADK